MFEGGQEFYNVRRGLRIVQCEKGAKKSTI